MIAEIDLIILGSCAIVAALFFAASTGVAKAEGDEFGKYICFAAALVMVVLSAAAFHSARRLSEDRTPKCPQCKTEIEEEYHYCPVCGYDLDGGGE